MAHDSKIMLRMKWHLLIILGAISSLAATAPLPPNQLLLDSKPELFKLVGQASAQAIAKIVSAQGSGFDRAWQIEVQTQPQAEYQVQLAATVPAKMSRGDTIWLSVWARALDSSQPDHQGRIGLVLEQRVDPYDKIISRSFDIGPDWQCLDIAAKLTRDFTPGSSQICLRAGFFPQTLQIGTVELRRFDPSIAPSDLPQTSLTYRGRDPNAAWRRQADARIESIRKSLLTVRVTDAAGHPVSGAAVQIRMLRHAFAFGSAYSDTRFPAAGAETTDDLAYQHHFAELFNTGVDEWAMKWPDWENRSTRQAALRALQWMHDHNIAVRGHNLVWPGWRHLPPDLRALANDPPALEHRIDQHIRDTAGALAGQLTEWDVINEPHLNNDLMHILGNDAMATWFNVAHEADPSTRLYLNETDVPDSPPRDARYTALYNEIQSLQRQGAPINGIGMQAHFSDNLVAPTDLLAIYDRFATLGIPIRVTELDIETADEQLQADYFRDFLTASFSDPEINGIILWGFWESQHWRPDAALVRKDWTIKPNGRVWKDLVFGKWWTNTNATTVADGTCSTQAFLGDYNITASSGRRTRTIQISLPHEGRTIDIQLN